MLVRLARFSYRRRRLVLLGWVVALVALVGLANGIGPRYSTRFALAGSDAQAAEDVLRAAFSERAGTTATVVVEAPGGVRDPAVRARVESLLAEVAALPTIEAIRSPYAGGGGAQISADGRIAYAELQFESGTRGKRGEAISRMRALRAEFDAPPGLRVEFGGEDFQGHSPPASSELIGILAAVIILLVAFGSILAMGLPILTALFGIGIGFAFVSLLSRVVAVPDVTNQLAAMIGIGVGIDYALFIVTRYRQGLHDGLGPERAVTVAIDTAGRAVLFAGSTVVISLAGLLIMGVEFVRGLAYGAAAVVFVTMAASITLVPAVLGFVGLNIDRWSLPFAHRSHHRDRPSAWYRWSRLLQRHSRWGAIAGLGVLVAMSWPVLSMRLGASDASAVPTTDTTRRAYDLLAEGFGPGFNGPLLLAAELHGPGDLEAVQRVSDELAHTRGVAGVSPAYPNPDGTAAVVQVFPTTAPQDAATSDLIARLRHEVIPRVTAGSGVQVHVGGLTAAYDDLASTLQARLPLFIGAVLTLSFLLLMIVFRSILVPLKAVIMNLLSIGAAYGLLVLVFQEGYGGAVIGLGRTGPIESYVPMLLFAVLFGLSMDYEVFLLSRIKEEYDRSGDNSTAVADGLAHTARVITAAALIMVTVFGSFVLDDQRVIKLFGFGLGMAIFIDATIIRMVLVPATMELLGDANWWLPKWLHWLPVVNVDGNDVHAITDGDEGPDPRRRVTVG